MPATINLDSVTKSKITVSNQSNTTKFKTALAKSDTITTSTIQSNIKPNVLFNYASYTYIIGLGLLTPEQFNFPDDTYRKGDKIKLICKSGGLESSNRINTIYGKQEFYIDNVVMSSTIGLTNGNNNNVMLLDFEVYEPYSMGLFLLACQQAVFEINGLSTQQEDNGKLWRDAMFILTIDFKGNVEEGTMMDVPVPTIYLPFTFATIEMTTNEAGSKYTCKAVLGGQLPLISRYHKLKSDVSIKGTTVQEVLQSGEKSLQVVLNQRLKKLYEVEGIAKEPDEILILFPRMIEEGQNQNRKRAESATTDPSQSKTTEDLYKRLNVTKDTEVEGNLKQKEETVNSLGKAKMLFSPDKKGDLPIAYEDAAYDEDLKAIIRSQVEPENYNTSDLRFGINDNITNIINQVLFQSEVSKNLVDKDQQYSNGWKMFWRVQTEMFYKPAKDNLKQLGREAYYIVFNVTEYSYHWSKATAVNTKAPGIEDIKSWIVKRYDYIYTGKNVDILKFNIVYNNTLATSINAGNFSAGGDNKLKSPTSSEAPQTENRIKVLGEGEYPTSVSNSTNIEYELIDNRFDNRGGGGAYDARIQAAKNLAYLITNSLEMLLVDMEIVGDPYWIVQDGFGNFPMSAPKEGQMLEDKRGFLLWRDQEVDCEVYFRTPVDINQATGKYAWYGSWGGEDLFTFKHFSGIYNVYMVDSHFKGGMFTQTLKLRRRPNQELKQEADAEKTYNVQETGEKVQPGGLN